MTQCFLGFGSNTNRESFLRTGLAKLHQSYTIKQVSPVYRSPALGFDGADFYNFCVEIEADTTLAQLNERLKEIEDSCGRDRTSGRYSLRTLDIDILLFGDRVGEHYGIVLPRPEIVRNSFVLKPLIDIAPNLNDPADGASYQSKWEEMVASCTRPLEPVDAAFLTLT